MNDTTDTSGGTSGAADLLAFLTQHKQRYLGSGGSEGHILDMSGMGGHAYAPHLMIRYIGRKSGKTYITPLTYGTRGGEVCVVGSKGGSPQHPSWYLNIRAAETVDFQVATEAFRATWREPAGEERARLWELMVSILPNYEAYQAATDRLIPLILMKPVERIPVFRAEDITG